MKNKQGMKQLKITFLLIVFLSMTGIKATAHNIEVANADGQFIFYKWTNNQTELEVSYRGSSYYDYSNEYSGNVVIPESVTYNGNTYPVTSIGSSAFYYCSGLTSVTIPNSLTSIGDAAFKSTAIYDNAPTGVLYVDKWVCGYKGTMPAHTAITLNEGTRGISDNAFSY